jgi:hypothetical protein
VDVTWKEAYQDAAQKVEDLTRANLLLKQENDAIKGKLGVMQNRVDDMEEAFAMAKKIKEAMERFSEDFERLYTL